MRLARKTRKRGGQSWTPQEDATISAAVLHTPPGSRPSWSDIALSLCGRTGKQCRDRYNGQLQPGISKLDWTEQEERTLAEAYCRQGSRWAALARLLPGRTENNVKNRAWPCGPRKGVRHALTLPGLPLRLACHVALQGLSQGPSCTTLSQSVPAGKRTGHAADRLSGASLWARHSQPVFAQAHSGARARPHGRSRSRAGRAGRRSWHG